MSFLKKTLIALILTVLIPLANASAALHGFKILSTPEKPSIGKDITLKVRAIDEKGRKEKTNIKVLLRAERRGEKIEREISLVNGEGSTTVLFDFSGSRIITVTNNDPVKEVFTSIPLEVLP